MGTFDQQPQHDRQLPEQGGLGEGKHLRGRVAVHAAI